MGNCKSTEHVVKPLTHTIDQTLKEKAYKIEREILSLTNLKLDEEIYIQDVPIDHYGENYIHCIRAGKKSDNIKEHVILVHGFRSCSIAYYKLFEKLYPQFNVYSIDLPGMALSSRPNLEFKDTEQCINFFVDAIEKFCLALNIEKFYLVGHSFGGYMSGQYALKYPHRIKKLCLLSSAGISDIEKGGDINENMPPFLKKAFYIFRLFWGRQITIRSLYSCSLSKSLIKKGLRRRYRIGKTELELLAQLTEATLEYPPDLDSAMYYIFKHPIPSVHFPLEQRFLEEVKTFNVEFYFGEKDWMDTIGSKRLCEADPDRFKIFYLNDSGHNFNLENTDLLSGFLCKLGDTIEQKEDLVQTVHTILENDGSLMDIEAI